MLGFCPPGDTALRSMVDPRDYDRLRYFQMNGGVPNTFEETIHRVRRRDTRKYRQELLDLGFTLLVANLLGFWSCARIFLNLVKGYFIFYECWLRNFRMFAWCFGLFFLVHWSFSCFFSQVLAIFILISFLDTEFYCRLVILWHVLLLSINCYVCMRLSLCSHFLNRN